MRHGCRTPPDAARPRRAATARRALGLRRRRRPDRDDHCKVAAIEAIGSLKEVDPRTEPYLVRRLDGNAEADPRIRYAALNALRKIGKKDLGSKPEAWRAYVLAKYNEKIDPAPVE